MIQGTSAEMSKLAGIDFFRWIVENDLFNTVKMCVPLHDEWVVECPKNLSEEAFVILKDSMEDAGKVFCKRIPIYATPVIGDKWDH